MSLGGIVSTLAAPFSGLTVLNGGLRGLLSPPSQQQVAVNPQNYLRQATSGANQALKRYMTGTLTGNEKNLIKSTVGNYTRSTNAQLRQEMASAGLSKSSAAVMMRGAVTGQAAQMTAQMTEQFLNQDLQDSMGLMGMDLNAYYGTEKMNMESDAAMMQAIAGVAQGAGQMIGAGMG